MQGGNPLSQEKQAKQRERVLGHKNPGGGLAHEGRVRASGEKGPDINERDTRGQKKKGSELSNSNYPYRPGRDRDIKVDTGKVTTQEG